LRANVRRAGWNLIMHVAVLYDMAWAGQWHSIQTKVRAWILSCKHTFNTLDPPLDCAATLEFKPDNKHLGESNSKGKQGSFRKAAIRNVIFDYPSLILRKTPAVIRIILTLFAIPNWANPTRPVEAAVPTYEQRCHCQRKPTKPEWKTTNALPALSETTIPTFLPNRASGAQLSRTPAITAAMTGHKISSKSHLTRRNEKPGLPLPGSNSTGETASNRVRIGKLGKLNCICNLA
jgi:hypothetical protein